MGIIKKIGTGFRILTTEGPKAFFETAKYSLGTLFGSFRPDESQIAYQALKTDRQTGMMIDVGAHHGFGLELFAANGWQVYAFEPDTENRSVLEANYTDQPNVIIDPRAVSDQPQEKMTLYKSPESTGMSGLSSFHPSHTVGEEVQVTTLELFLKEQGVTDGEIDFLKIDTEGYDLFVLKGIPWKNNPPALILCEFEDTKTLPLGYSFHDLAQFLEEQGYKLIVSEWYPIREYGGLHDWKRFTTYPCELGDPKAWGNILAAREDDLYQTLRQVCNLSG